jgi:ATP-dependent DNA ligase
MPIEVEREGNDKMNAKKIAKIRYPELESIIHQYPNPEIILGKEIVWEEKRDGSCAGIWLPRKNLRMRSKNLDNASNDMRKAFIRTGLAPNVNELINDMIKQWRQKDVVIFGELLQKGKSPTRTEFHEKDDFVVFDIYADGKFMTYTQVHQYCYQYKIPFVEIYGTSRHTTMESLLQFRDQMLEMAKSKGREGVVGKIYEGEKTRFFKEKLDLPKIDKLPRKIDDGKPHLPELPESEILGALEKVRVDIGDKKLRDIKEAMPLFAKYVKIECDKHNCRCTAKLFPIYKKRLEEL